MEALTLILIFLSSQVSFEERRLGQTAQRPGGREPFVFSPDGRRVAYSYSTPKGDVVVVDGAERLPVKVARLLTFSTDGEHFAYVCEQDGTGAAGHTHAVVLDGARGQDYYYVRRIYFSADSKSLAAEVMLKPGEWCLVLDGKAGPIFQEIAEATFLPDGRPLYKAKDSKGERAVVGSDQGDSFVWIRDLVFSPDGKRIAFRAATTGFPQIIADGKRVAIFETVSAPAFSPDSQQLIYGYQKAGQSFLVAGGKTIEQPACVREIAASPNGTSIAFVQNIPGVGTRVVLDGKPGRAIDKAGPPFFTPSGLLGYVAQINDMKQLVLGDTVGPAFRRIDLWIDTPDDALELRKRPAFSPDGKTIAYRATNQVSWSAIVGGETTVDKYDFVGPPVFSADGRMLAFGARSGDELWWRVLNLP